MKRLGLTLAAGVAVLMSASTVGAAKTPFRMTEAPVVTSLSATAGPSGLRLSLIGSHLEGDGLTRTVTYNGVTVFPTAPPGTTGEHELSVRVPFGAKSGKFTVTNGAGSGSSPTFTVLAQVKPVITSFTPANGPVGTWVTITGKHFVGADRVTFGKAGVKVDTDGDDTEIRARVPKPASTAKLTVVSSKGTAVGSTFKVTRVPVLRPVPHNRTAAVGAQVALQGTNLDTVTGATIGGLAAAVVPESADWVRVVVPSGVPSGSRFQVTNPAGTSNLSSYTFAVTPRIDSFSPHSGPRDSVVELKGSGFSSATEVTFGSISSGGSGAVQAAFTIDSDTTMHVKVPVKIPAKAGSPSINVWVSHSYPRAYGISPGGFQVTAGVAEALGL